MNEVEIPIKVSGLGAIKAELRALKGEIANATDPADIQRLSQAAGALNDKIKDANESVKNFSTGSPFESSRNQINGIQDSLMNLDFAEAGEKMQGFAKTLGGIKPDTLTKGLGAISKGVTQLGGAFLKMGLQLLVNPIFLLVIVIVAIVAVVVLLMNKFGILTKAIDFMMMPLNMLISLFEKLTDWMGLTSNAADANAATVAAANAKIQESTKARGDMIAGAYDYEIRMAKINGKDTTKLELSKSLDRGVQARNRINGNKAELRSLFYDDSEEAMKRKTELIKNNIAENKIISDARKERKIIRAEDRQSNIDDATKTSKDNAEAAAQAAKAAADRRKQEKTNRLNAARLIRDLEIAAMQEGSAKEIDIINQKYKVMREDLAADANKTAAEKAIIDKRFVDQRTADLDKSEKDRQKIIVNNFNLGQQQIAELTLSSMAEGTEKDLAMQTDKYDKLRKGVTDSITLTEIQKAALIKLYNDQEVAESEKTIKENAAKASELLFQLQATAKDKELKALQDKYAAQLLIAGQNKDAQLALAEQLGIDKTAIENKYTQENIMNAEKERQAKLQVATEVVNGISALGGAFIKDQKKLEKFNKASALVQIGIDTAKAISALVAAANANPLNAVSAGTAGIAQFASGIVQIITNIAKAKQLLSSPSASPSASPSGGNTDSGTSAASVVPMGPTLIGGANQGNSFNAGGGTNNMTVTAIVSETQVTSTQNKINRIYKSAEL